MSPSLVIGANGQDGSYLVEELLARGREVVGVGQQSKSRYISSHPRYRYVRLDLRDLAPLSLLLEDIAPGAIYHLAAIHGPSGFVYEDKWSDALTVNVGSLHACLEAMRNKTRSCSLFYASSIKTLRPNTCRIIDDTSERNTDCLYSITKHASDQLIEYYRKHHNVNAWCGYLSNHESPRRNLNYFLPRLVGHLAAALGREQRPPPIYSLDFDCDWGSSKEFMRAVADITEARNTCDLILASGVTWNGRKLAQRLGEAAGLTDVDWAPVKITKGDSASPPAIKIDVSRLKQVWRQELQCDGFEVALWIARERFGLHDILNVPG